MTLPQPEGPAMLNHSASFDLGNNLRSRWRWSSSWRRRAVHGPKESVLFCGRRTASGGVKSPRIFSHRKSPLRSRIKFLRARFLTLAGNKSDGIPCLGGGNTRSIRARLAAETVAHGLQDRCSFCVGRGRVRVEPTGKISVRAPVPDAISFC
jgi:hypothetical protein